MHGSVHGGSSQGVPTQAVLDSSSDLFDTTLLTAPSAFNHPHPQGPTLKRVPKVSRPQAAALVTKIIRDVLIDVSRVKPWARLLDFAHVCFVRPARGGRSRNLTTLVSRQVAAFDSGGLVTTRASIQRSARRGQLNDDEAAAKRASAKLEEGNIKGALQLLSSVDSVAPCTRVIYDSLKALHPSSPPNRRPPPVPSGDPLRVMSSEVR